MSNANLFHLLLRT